MGVRILQWFTAAFGHVPPPVMLALVFLGGLVEATPVLGLVVPAHTFVFLVAAGYGIQGSDPTMVLLACALGGVLGDVVFFALGRRWGIAFMDRLPGFLRLGPARRAALSTLMDAHGMKAVLLARSQPVTRCFAPYVAGASGLSAPRFLPAAALGSLLVAVAVVAAGYVTGLGHDYLGTLVEGSVAFVAIGAVVLLTLHFLLTRRFRILRPVTLHLAMTTIVAGAAAWLLVRDAAGAGRVHAFETTHWPTTLAAVPAGVAAGSRAIGWLGDVHLLAALLLGLFAIQAWRQHWVRAFTTLAAGPGLLGLLLMLRWRLPRTAPDGLAAAFPMTGSFPNETAALAVALAAMLGWGTRWRSRVARTCWTGGGLAIGLTPLVAGRAWPTDVMAGFAVGTAWAAACLVTGLAASTLTTPAADLNAAARRIKAWWLRATAWADRVIWGNQDVLWGIVGFGVALRLVAPWWWAVGPDADRYSAMGLAFERSLSFTMPWGDVYSPGTGPAPSHHFPPLYPAVLAGSFHLLGFSRTTLRVASIVLSLGALAATYACTRDLYGKSRALVATAVVAISPVLVLTTNKAYSENLLVALFVLAMWAILKSLEKPWYIVWGALFAGLGYLAKSSMGYFFIIAGLGGLAWRLRWRGWRVLLEIPYLTAIALFAAVVAGWGVRNWLLFGDWQSSTHLTAAYHLAFAHPWDWAQLAVFSTLFIFGIGYLFFLAVAPWLPHLRRIPRLESEHDSGLWLAVLLPLPLTVVIDAALWLYERDFYFHNVRYVTFALVPLVWLLMRHVRPSPSAWAAIGVSFLMLFVASAYYAIPSEKIENEVSTEWGPLVHDGDSVTFVGTNDVYRYYFDLTANGTRQLDVKYIDGPGGAAAATDWVLTRGGAVAPDGYLEVLERHRGEGALRDTIRVWHRP